jgi:hypothetical protein
MRGVIFLYMPERRLTDGIGSLINYVTTDAKVLAGI